MLVRLMAEATVVTKVAMKVGTMVDRSAEGLVVMMAERSAESTVVVKVES